MWRARLWIMCVGLLMSVAAGHAQPYAYSTTPGTLQFDFTTHEQHGSGSDIWVWTVDAASAIYGFWGDGNGWNNDQPLKSYLGITEIPAATSTPNSNLTGSDIYHDDHTTGNYKPSAYVAHGSGGTATIRGFYHHSTDTWRSARHMTSTDGGASWTFGSTDIWNYSSDGVVVLGMAQAGPGYTDLPAHISDTYYYVYLGVFNQYHEETIGSATADEIYLARVAVADIGTKASYECVTALSGDTPPVPTWGSCASKIPVFEDSAGNNYVIGVTWWPQLNRWILSKTHHPATVANPWRVGIFEGERPWGPWKTMFYGDLKDTLRKFSVRSVQPWMSVAPTSPPALWVTWSGNPEYDNANWAKATVLASSDTTAPGPPTGLTVTTNSWDQLTLTYAAPTVDANGNSPSGVNAYRIFWCAGASCTDWTQQTDQASTTFVHTGRTAGTIYRYKVQAVDAANNASIDSAIVQGETTHIVTVLMSATSTPDNWTLGAGASKLAAVSSTAGTDDADTSYIRSATSGQQQQFAITNPTGPTANDTITRVELWAVSRRDGQAVSLVMTGVLPGPLTTASGNLSQATGYAAYSLPMATKPGGGNWTLTDANNLEFRVQPSTNRGVRVTQMEAVLYYNVDPAPNAPAQMSTTVTDATTLTVNWTNPTLNSDGSSLSDLTSVRLYFCNTASCDPATGTEVPNSPLTPTGEGQAQNYVHSSLTTSTTYWYAAVAVDANGKTSNPSQYAYGTPEEITPVYARGHWRFYVPGAATMTALSDENTAFQVRTSGTVRLVQQITNTQAAGTRTFPLECKIGAGSYATLTDSCANPGVCLRDLGVALQIPSTNYLTLPSGYTYEQSGVAFTTTWPALGIGANQASEMIYDIGITGQPAGQVCCRPATLDDYTGGADACFTPADGVARRG